MDRLDRCSSPLTQSSAACRKILSHDSARVVRASLTRFLTQNGEGLMTRLQLVCLIRGSQRPRSSPFILLSRSDS